MMRMVYSWLTITLARQSGGVCRIAAAGSEQGAQSSQSFFPVNILVKMEITIYFI